MLVQLAFLLRKFHGPHFANDSARYLDYAADIAERGYFEPGHNLRYVLYPLFQSLWLWLGLGWWGIVAGQMAVSALATRAVYRGTRRLASGRRGAAALATLLFIAWPDIQQFNVFLLTESLFISLVALSFGAFTRVRAGRRQRLGPADSAAACSRPWPGPTASWWPWPPGWPGLDALRRRPRPRGPGGRRCWCWCCCRRCCGAALNHQLATYYLMDTYQRGELIFRYQLWAVHQAAPLDMPPPGTGPVARVLYFAVHNPVYLARLMAGQAVRFRQLPQAALLAGAPRGGRAGAVARLLCWRPGRRGARGIWRPGRVFLAGIFLLQTAIIMLTVDDWDVRFLAPVLPPVFVLAALELVQWLEARSDISRAGTGGKPLRYAEPGRLHPGNAPNRSSQPAQACKPAGVNGHHRAAPREIPFPNQIQHAKQQLCRYKSGRAARRAAPETAG